MVLTVDSHCFVLWFVFFFSISPSLVSYLKALIILSPKVFSPGLLKIPHKVFK